MDMVSISFYVRKKDMKLRKITAANNEMDSCFLGNMSDCNDLLIVESLNVCDTVHAAAVMDRLCLIERGPFFNSEFFLHWNLISLGTVWDLTCHHMPMDNPWWRIQLDIILRTDLIVMSSCRWQLDLLKSSKVTICVKVVVSQPHFCILKYFFFLLLLKACISGSLYNAWTGNLRVRLFLTVKLRNGGPSDDLAVIIKGCFLIFRHSGHLNLYTSINSSNISWNS